jgi:predicted glutamine amidotransferase
LVGVVASEPTEFSIALRDAPRSMAHLSKEHRDGWGIAVYEDEGGGAWQVHRGVETAFHDDRYHALAGGARGEVLIAHVRRRTVGPITVENTHPFERGPWIFAHNGTIKDLAFVRASISPRRLAEVRGETDSELFFALLLSRLDEAGLADAPPSEATDTLLANFLQDVRAQPSAGSISFLLGTGNVLYAHRFGRTLCVLDRRPGDPVLTVRESRENVVVGTGWTPRRRAVLIASEHLTDEPWIDLGDGELVRVDRFPEPNWRTVR